MNGIKRIIFYSWQATYEAKTNRYFIENCIKRAIKQINTNDSVELEVRLDHDTKNKIGSPSIVETILNKIVKSSIFICDVSIINSNSNEKKTLNPNVAIELGYAASALGWENIILVFNLSSGNIEDLPFDIRHRRILSYSLKNNEDKKKPRELLVRAIKLHIIQSSHKNKTLEIDILSKNNISINGKIVSNILKPISKKHFVTTADLKNFGIIKRNDVNPNTIRGIEVVTTYRSENKWIKYIDKIVSEFHDEDPSVFMRGKDTTKLKKIMNLFIDKDSYFEDMCAYISDINFFNEYIISIENTSSKATFEDVFVELIISSKEVIIHDTESFPAMPKTNTKKENNGVSVIRTNSSSTIAIEVGTVRPLQTVRSKSSFYIASKKELSEFINVNIFMRNNEPFKNKYPINFSTNERDMNVNDIISFSKKL